MSGPLVTGFQGSVNNQPAVGEAGDFYGTNPRAVPLAGSSEVGSAAPAAFVAPAGGLIVGNFCWADSDLGVVSQSFVAGRQVCMLRRGNNTLIVNFLAPATYQLLQGLPADLFTYGDFWAKFAGGATPGQLVYADEGTGAPVAASTAPNTASFTGSIGTTADIHASAAAGVLTVTQVPTSGIISVGDVISGTGVTGAPTIVSQLTGGAGGLGTYQLAPNTAAFSAATDVQATSTVLNVTAVASGVLNPGDVFTGASVTSGNQILSQLAGAVGGIGTYRISIAQAVTSEAMTIAAAPTGWIVNSVAAAGELALISKWG